MTDSHDQLPDPECAPLIKKPAGGTPPLVTTVQGILEWCARVKADEDRRRARFELPILR